MGCTLQRVRREYQDQDGRGSDLLREKMFLNSKPLPSPHGHFAVGVRLYSTREGQNLKTKTDIFFTRGLVR